MASYSRNELVNKFRKELEDWNNAPAASALKAPKDTPSTGACPCYQDCSGRAFKPEG
ncbi:hypothetical protein [Salmonella phage NINP13076]|nr:hypothetical protein [Salmonella phage NINP13076]